MIQLQAGKAYGIRMYIKEKNNAISYQSQTRANFGFKLSVDDLTVYHNTFTAAEMNTHTSMPIE